MHIRNRNVTVASFGNLPYNQRTLIEKGTQMKTKLAAVAIVGSMLAAPAFAWGDREQGALAGMAGLLLWQHINRPPVVVQGPSHYPAPQPPVYQSYPPVAAPIYTPTCRQVLTIQIDRYGNEYRTPATICQ